MMEILLIASVKNIKSSVESFRCPHDNRDLTNVMLSVKIQILLFLIFFSKIISFLERTFSNR